MARTFQFDVGRVVEQLDRILQMELAAVIYYTHYSFKLSVDFDGREITYGFGELDELVLAYATSIHKSQGSEYPAVVVPLTTEHYPML